MGIQKSAPEDNSPAVTVTVWVRVSFEVRGRFSWGAIVLEPLRWCI